MVKRSDAITAVDRVDLFAAPGASRLARRNMSDGSAMIVGVIRSAFQKGPRKLDLIGEFWRARGPVAKAGPSGRNHGIGGARDLGRVGVELAFQHRAGRTGGRGVAHAANADRPSVVTRLDDAGATISALAPQLGPCIVDDPASRPVTARRTRDRIDVERHQGTPDQSPPHRFRRRPESRAPARTRPSMLEMPTIVDGVTLRAYPRLCRTAPRKGSSGT